MLREVIHVCFVVKLTTMAMWEECAEYIQLALGLWEGLEMW